MTIIEQIKAEIEKRIWREREVKDRYGSDTSSFVEGSIDALDGLLSFLSTLESEKDGLDKEIGKIWETCEPVDEGMGVETANIHIEQFDYIARHFYELGCRRTAEKYDEIEYNRQQAEEQVCDNFQSEYERYIASRKDGLSCYNVSVNIKDMAEHFAQWGAEHLADARKTSPNDLEEAAGEYAREYNGGDDWEDDIKFTFIAGAKWQAEQLLKSSPLPEDTVLFNKGVEEGRRLAEEEQADLFTIVALDAAQRAKEQMMKEFPKWKKIMAGERLPCPSYVWTIAYDNYPDCFEGRLMPNIEGVKVGRDTWYLPVDVIHNLPKED